MSTVRTRWPGLGPAGTLVVPVDPSTWPPPRARVTLAGVEFAPKRELHVTVIGKALGARVLAALPEADVAMLFEPLDWAFVRTRRVLHVRRRVDADAIEQTLIERVEQPAMAAFHGALSQRIGEVLPVPPPHVTLYVHGTDEGIGLPDEESLARWTVGEIEVR